MNRSCLQKGNVMRFIYPAVIHPNEDGTYTATMVDLEGCSATGFSIDDCLEEINAAALNWITIELEEDGVLPPITEHEDIRPRLKENEFIRNVSVIYRMYDGWDE